MALDYLLYVIADLEPEHLGQRLFPGIAPTAVDPGDIAERDVVCMCCEPVTLPHVTYDRWDAQGMSVRVEASPHRDPERLGRSVRMHAKGDDGEEVTRYLKPCASVVFELRDDDALRPARQALEAVTRFAHSGPENFYYLHNHHYLLLSRAHGELRRHRPKWWDWHGGFDDLVPSTARARTYPERPAAHAPRSRRRRG
ncbi:hypothetical protein [Kineosporia sp. NBRC 101731]|uniref:hypothetical protein n=1 Tax=Kineosporia sp. NBRC 101731 TaxID=3032199 RepID=UPI00255290FE|nr:hypothetical protein [Kineosporia sp. NBRC 101731]